MAAAVNFDTPPCRKNDYLVFGLPNYFLQHEPNTNLNVAYHNSYVFKTSRGSQKGGLKVLYQILGISVKHSKYFKHVISNIKSAFVQKTLNLFNTKHFHRV